MIVRRVPQSTNIVCELGAVLEKSVRAAQRLSLLQRAAARGVLDGRTEKK